MNQHCYIACGDNLEYKVISDPISVLRPLQIVVRRADRREIVFHATFHILRRPRNQNCCRTCLVQLVDIRGESSKFSLLYGPPINFHKAGGFIDEILLIVENLFFNE